jgi:hypothetical protein
MSMAFIVLLSLTVPIVKAQTVGPNDQTTRSFNPGENVSDAIGYDGSINLFGLIGAEVVADISVFSGVDLPFEMTVVCPEWVVGGNSFATTYSAQGKSGGRAGIDFSAGLDIKLIVLTVPLTLYEETLALDLSADFTTPLGSEVSKPMTNEVRLAGIDVPLVGGEVAAYFGVVAEAELRGVVSSAVSASGSALTSQLSETLVWDSQGETHTRALGTTSSGPSSVSVSLNDITLSMEELIIRVTSLFIEFRALGFDPVRLSLPLPDLFSGSAGTDAEYGGYSLGPLSIDMMSSPPPNPSAPGPTNPIAPLLDSGGLGLVLAVGVVIVVIGGIALFRRR